ncbi:MAG: histidinol phosphate phosphatase domain-containing protein [candidate division Zixibacteria bacterium]|nr:histidinol phosphate phosphatase domain-containing protein [candidate division Zixibacteria bacterium]
MIDLHTHTVLSDGAVLPAELVRYAEISGYEAIALTDHVDSGTMETVLKQLIKVAEDLNRQGNIKVLPGVEITHMPPALIPEMAKEARKLGAKIVVVHGESPVEPVCPKTNLSALQSDIDILAHPGMIKEEEVKLAEKRGIYLELSARKGHCLTNGRLVMLARKYQAKLVMNTDAHRPGELFSEDFLRKVGLGAGLTEEEFKEVLQNSVELVKKRF